jgi:hypothetical protein
MESNEGPVADMVGGESGEGQCNSADGSGVITYKYQYPKQWDWENMFDFETEELKEFIQENDFSNMFPTEAMKAYRIPESEMMLIGTKKKVR